MARHVLDPTNRDAAVVVGPVVIRVNFMRKFFRIVYACCNVNGNAYLLVS